MLLGTVNKHTEIDVKVKDVSDLQCCERRQQLIRYTF